MLTPLFGSLSGPLSLPRQIEGAPALASPGALFVREDATTNGNWPGVYGADGAIIINDGYAPPGYASVSFAGGNTYTWNGNTSEDRGLRRLGSPENTTNRIISAYYNDGVVYAFVTVPSAKQVAIYLVDGDNQNRVASCQPFDPATNLPLADEQIMYGFDIGKWQVWRINGTVRFHFRQISGANSVFAALFFDP